MKQAPMYKILLLVGQLIIPYNDTTGETYTDIPNPIDGRQLCFIDHGDGRCDVIDQYGEIHVTFEEDGYASYISDWAKKPYAIPTIYPLYD